MCLAALSWGVRVLPLLEPEPHLNPAVNITTVKLQKKPRMMKGTVRFLKGNWKSKNFYCQGLQCYSRRGIIFLKKKQESWKKYFFGRWSQSEGNTLRTRLFPEKYCSEVKEFKKKKSLFSQRTRKVLIWSALNHSPTKWKIDYSSSTDTRITWQIIIQAKVAAYAIQCFAKCMVWTPIYTVQPGTAVQRERALTSSGHKALELVKIIEFEIENTSCGQSSQSLCLATLQVTVSIVLDLTVGWNY